MSPGVHAYTGNARKNNTNAASVSVKSEAMQLIVGQSANVKASVKGVEKKMDVIAHVALLRYYSTNRNVAKVDGNGNVTATGKGSCSIVAVASNGVRARVRVKVLTAPTAMAFGKESYGVKKGKTLDLAAKLQLTPKDTKATLTWTTSDKQIAKVNKKGVVKGVKKGAATITVKAENGKKVRVKVVVK